jgi:hypothetical protein
MRQTALQESRPLIFIRVRKVHLRYQVCIETLVQVRVHLRQVLGERNLDKQRFAVETLHLPNCSLSMACSIIARCPTICPI